MSLMPYFTTATELQRNYKKVVRKAKKLKKPIAVLSNSKPELVLVDYDVFGLSNAPVGDDKEDLLSLSGSLSEKEADKLIKDTDEMFEIVNPEDWR